MARQEFLSEEYSHWLARPLPLARESADGLITKDLSRANAIPIPLNKSWMVISNVMVNAIKNQANENDHRAP